MKRPTRVRFAPAPTGFMHLGNARTAIINYLFAMKNKGSFILRLEDTDQSRNFDKGGIEIIKDLKWLGLSWNEGFDIGGSFGPYKQSEKDNDYKKRLEYLGGNYVVQ